MIDRSNFDRSCASAIANAMLFVDGFIMLLVVSVIEFIHIYTHNLHEDDKTISSFESPIYFCV